MEFQNHQSMVDAIKKVFSQQMPFNQLLGLEVCGVEPEGAEIRLSMKPDLVGNPAMQILHGGVTSSVLDVAGGLVVMAAAVSQFPLPMSVEEFKTRSAKFSTIDLRVDFLRPGRGERFVATSRIIRSGNKVAVARMELHNQKGSHIAFGTGTYMVG